MDKITRYQSIIKEILQKHLGNDFPPKEEYDEQVIIDDLNGHYLLMGVGWDSYKRVHGISLHLDLKDGKIWIQTDWTEPGVANELEEMGVPKSDIVLAFHAPYRRKLIEEYSPG